MTPLRPEVAASDLPLIQSETAAGVKVSIALIVDPTFPSVRRGVARSRLQSLELLRANPIDGLRGQFVECVNRELQMLLARVFNLVVAYSLEGLHEHHHGGDSGARNFSG